MSASLENDHFTIDGHEPRTMTEYSLCLDFAEELWRERGKKIADLTAYAGTLADCLRWIRGEMAGRVGSAHYTVKIDAALAQVVAGELLNQRQGADSPYVANTDPSGDQDHAPAPNKAFPTVGALNAPLETPIAQSAPASLADRAQRMQRDYQETGAMKAADVHAVLGDPAKGVTSSASAVNSAPNALCATCPWPGRCQSGRMCDESKRGAE